MGSWDDAAAPEDAGEGEGGGDAFAELPIPQKGTLLVGKYRVEGVVGFGGMGIVVAAKHEHIGERVALKMLLPSYACVEENRARFQREAQAAFKLRSEHVCRVLDAGELEDGTPFIAMEFLKGEDLGSRLRKKGKLPIEEAVSYILQACDALAEAHDQHIVHRDLKPGNLVVTTRKDGSPCVKVIDFGISKIAKEASGVTQTYAYVGSPIYSAPEHLAGARGATARSDIYSLGVALYQLILDRFPYEFDTDSLAAILAIVERTDPVPMRDVDPSIPKGLDAVVMRCLERDPNERWQSVRDLHDALERYASPTSTEGTPTVARAPLRDSPRRERVADGDEATAEVAAIRSRGPVPSPRLPRSVPPPPLAHALPLPAPSSATLPTQEIDAADGGTAVFTAPPAMQQPSSQAPAHMPAPQPIPGAPALPRSNVSSASASTHRLSFLPPSPAGERKAPTIPPARADLMSPPTPANASRTTGPVAVSAAESPFARYLHDSRLMGLVGLAVVAFVLLVVAIAVARRSGPDVEPAASAAATAESTAVPAVESAVTAPIAIPPTAAPVAPPPSASSITVSTVISSTPPATTASNAPSSPPRSRPQTVRPAAPPAPPPPAPSPASSPAGPRILKDRDGRF